MKKIFAVFVLIFCCFGVCGQKLIERNSAGIRSVSTEPVMMRTGMTDRNPINLVLSCSQVDGVNKWGLRIYIQSYTSFSIPQGGKLLIKKTTDDVIELIQEFPESETSDPIGKRSDYGIIYTMSASYAISEDELAKIGSIGIKKMRIETTADHIDKEFKPEKISPFFKLSYDAIKKEIDKSPADIHDRF